MKRLLLSLLKHYVHWRLRDIPIERVRFDAVKVPNLEGWGGKGAEEFPPTHFFRMFMEGDELGARVAMETWYYDRLMERKFHLIPKSENGMKDGSLVKLIIEMHRQESINVEPDLINVKDTILRRAIRQQVEHRFNLLVSIRDKGYNCYWDLVQVRNAGEHYILHHGHHRLAALTACGYSTIPACLSESWALWIVVRLVRQLR